MENNLKQSSFKGIIGVSQSDITPHSDCFMKNWGASSHNTASGIHQPLKLTCITFQTSKEQKPLILIAADLGWWKSMDNEWSLRGRLLKALDTEESNLMFCLSHTHAGPSICTGDVNKDEVYKIEEYLSFIVEKAVDAVKHAKSVAMPACLSWAYGKCGLAKNRDLKQSERYVVGFNPNGEADDTLLVGRITNLQEKTIATIVNYACHPTILAWQNRLISPDYIGTMRYIVEEKTLAPCLFLQGASGELAPAEQYVTDIEVVESAGREVGYAVLSALESLGSSQTRLAYSKTVESGAPLAVWERMPYISSDVLSVKMLKVKLPLKSLPPLEEIEFKWEECKDLPVKERLMRQLRVRKAVGNGDYASVPLWVWQLGDSFLIGHPNEAYSYFQKEIRQQLAPYKVAVINIVNGHIGYLPQQELYNENIYSVWQTPFAKGSLEIMTNKAVEAIENMSKFTLAQ